MSPDWGIIAEKYIYPYLISDTKDYAEVLKEGTGRNILHNEVFNMENEYFAKRGYKSQHSQKDIHKQGIVLNSDKMLPYIQARLIQEGKVIKYSRQGKEVVRNNVKWNEEEITEAKNFKAQGFSIKTIAKRLGRSYTSTYQKMRRMKAR